MKLQLLTIIKALLLLGSLDGSEATLLRGKQSSVAESSAGARNLAVIVNDCKFCHSNAACLDTDDAARFECVCKEGYDLDPKDGRSCIDRDECVEDKPCSEIGGFCVDHNPDQGFYSCGCLPGFEPTEFDEVMDHPISCIEQNECLIGSHTCDPNVGICNNTAGSYTCSCPDGYTMNVTSNACSEIPTVPISEPCDVKNCDSTSSYCVLQADQATAVCLCKPGFFQINRGGVCSDIAECDANGGQGQCHKDAKCDDLNGGYQCLCKTGYIGDGVISCVDANECNIGNHNCGDELMCVNEEGGFSCVEYPSAAPSASPTKGPTPSPAIPTSPPISVFDWVQRGQLLEGGAFGTAGNDIDFGRDVTMNGAGDRIAVGIKDAEDPKCGGKNNGAVIVFDFDGAEWVQVGTTIYSPGCDEDMEFGYNVEIAADGQSIAISSEVASNGTDCNCDDYVLIVVYEYDDTTSTWSPKGYPFVPTLTYDFGGSPEEVLDLSFSGDGSTVALVYYDTDDFLYTEIFRYNGTDWDPFFDDIFCGDTGTSVDLSYDGNRAAIGDAAYGMVFVVEYDPDADDWDILFNYTDVSSDGDSFGVSVALSNDGTTLAVGDDFYGKDHDDAAGHDGTEHTGRVHVFKEVGGTWAPIGAEPLIGGGFEFFGHDVDLDASGNTLAVGSLSVFDGTPGHVNVYILKDDDTWVRLGSEFGDGVSNQGHHFGRVVELSDDGRKLITGSSEGPTSHDGGTSGTAEVHRYEQIN